MKNAFIIQINSSWYSFYDEEQKTNIINLIYFKHFNPQEIDNQLLLLIYRPIIFNEYISYSYEYNIFDLCDKPCYFGTSLCLYYLGASLGLCYFNVYGSIVLYNHNKLNIIARVVYEMNKDIFIGLKCLDCELKFLFKKLFNLSVLNFFLLNFSITLSLRKKLEFHYHIVKENKKSNYYINYNLLNFLKSTLIHKDIKNIYNIAEQKILQTNIINSSYNNENFVEIINKEIAKSKMNITNFQKLNISEQCKYIHKMIYQPAALTLHPDKNKNNDTAEQSEFFTVLQNFKTLFEEDNKHIENNLQFFKENFSFPELPIDCETPMLNDRLMITWPYNK